MVIQQKAISLSNDLQEEEGASSEVKPFLASKGCFERLKKRPNLHNIKMSGEAASADTDSARKYPAELKKIIDKGGCTSEQVYNADETGLFWKLMPARTFISTEEKSAPRFKASKDRLTLLVGGNASGDMKLKPLLVYHSENPKAFKGYAKSNLPVIWHSNKKAWMTMTLFQDWFINFFCPAVERYYARRNISNKALLLLDNAPSHPVNLNDLSDNMRVEYIPKNTTSLLQPMDQGFHKMKVYSKFNTTLTLANNVGFEEVIENDVAEFLESHREDLTNEDLMVLEQERAVGQEEDIESPPTPLQLTTKDMSEGFALIQEGLQIFADNGPNRERSIKIARAVNNALSFYTELYNEKVRRKHQTTLDELFTLREKPKADDEADDDLQGRAEESSAPPSPTQ
ncbi:tigger transposable element-derived protein 1-like [Homarus americanus]|uniref:tigger transposable element-derived protein 1-like n=1 Tax=Homarus americanus TaxID=6706 RepID=UPI001C482EE6|nr:tigger transposable element-derived protein 1-like [Homarus americanus]